MFWLFRRMKIYKIFYSPFYISLSRANFDWTYHIKKKIFKNKKKRIFLYFVLKHYLESQHTHHLWNNYFYLYIISLLAQKRFILLLSNYNRIKKVYLLFLLLFLQLYSHGRFTFISKTDWLIYVIIEEEDFN